MKTAIICVIYTLLVYLGGVVFCGSFDASVWSIDGKIISIVLIILIWITPVTFAAWCGEKPFSD